MFIYTDYNNNNTNSGYDSDYSNYSEYSSSSTNSSGSSNSSNLSNSSNYTITSDPSNYYRKDNLKQNYKKFLKRLQQTQQTQQTSSPNCSISLRKKQTQNYLEMYRHKMIYIKDNEGKNNSNNDSTNNNIGYYTGFNKDTPFINYLINKRISFCVLGASSHIAAFVASTCSSRCCFIREWKGKDHYG
jgi:hypothetical protein